MSLLTASSFALRPVLLSKRADRRCLRVTASSETGAQKQAISTLQAALYLWTPAALAFTQGDVPISRSSVSQSTSSAGKSAGEAAQKAGEAAQQATEAVANELPDWLSENPLLLAGAELTYS